MSLTKTAIILGVTLIGLLGAIQYLKVENDNTVIEVKDPKLALRLELFEEWSLKFQKVYGVGERKRRFAIWNKMYDFIEEHNAKGLSWTVGLNQFSDLSNEEFSAMHTGFNWKPDQERHVTILETEGKPADVDWRTKGAVTAVEDQKQCGACYAFASNGALEALYFGSKGSLVNFSHQQIVDCSSNYGNQGCNGGLMDNTFKYTRDKGIMKASDYAYAAKNGTCKYNASKAVFKNKAYVDVKANDPAQLAAGIAKIPVAVAVQADQSVFQSYKSGIIDSTSCGTDLNHAILAVGYKNKAYWIVKNSWGTTWGEKGYVRIAYGTQDGGKGICGINMMASYPTL